MRQVYLLEYTNVSWVDIFLLTVVVLFGCILLHEFEHCFAAVRRRRPREILMWPLGGLAFTEIPHRWKPLFTTVAAGPAVNVAICLVCAIVITVSGFVPNLNPLTRDRTWRG